MTIKFKKGLVIFFMFVPLIVTFIFLNYLPESIPVHYGANGEVTRWGSKYESLIIPLIGLIICLISNIFTNSAVKKSEYKKNNNMLNMCNVVLLIMFNIVTISMLINNLNQITDLNNSFSSKLIYVAFGIIFIVIGSYLPKCKRNGLVGIRTSHTLSSDDIWYKTNKFGGKILVVFGCIYTIISLFIPISIAMTILIISLITITVIVSIYAKKLPNKNN